MKRQRTCWKSCAFVLSVVMLLPALGGCGQSGGGSSGSVPQSSVSSESSSGSAADKVSEAESGAAPVAVADGEVAGDDQMTEWQQGQGKPVTLNIFIQGSMDTSTYGNDIVSSTITEKTGVTLNFDVVPNDNGAKLNLLISSDQLPDLICASPSSSQGITMMKNDMVWTMDELMGQYAPNALNGTLFTPNNRQIYNLLQQGGFYGIPAEYTDRNKIDDGVFINQAPGSYYIREDLFDAAGVTELKTLADLEQGLLKVKENNPELKHPLLLWDAATFGNAGSGINVLYYSMGGKGQYLNNGGQIQSAVRDPLYKEVLLYVNRLFNEGLVNSSDFTDTYDTQNTLNSQETWAASAGPLWHVIVPHDTFAPEGKNAMAIDPLVEPGVTFEGPNGLMNGFSIAYVNKKTEYPDRCAWLLEYLLTEEGQTLVTAGIEGTHWEWGGPDETWIVPIGEAKTLMDQNFADWSSEFGTYKYNLCGRNYYDSAFCWGLAADSAFKQDVYQKEIHGVDATEYAGINPDPGSDEDAINTKFTTMVKNMIAQTCTASDQAAAAAVYDKFITDVDSLGLGKLEQIWTEKYNANLEIMNSVK